ncbi:hypothetical protein MMC11_005955 [Xylographa trunciseda]|nr:hypothetical protein [Xylographa trunciseda]
MYGPAAYISVPGGADKRVRSGYRSYVRGGGAPSRLDGGYGAADGGEAAADGAGVSVLPESEDEVFAERAGGEVSEVLVIEKRMYQDGEPAAAEEAPRVAQMEKKLDGLVALFAQPEASRTPSATADALPAVQSPTFFEQRNLEPQTLPGESEFRRPSEGIQSTHSTPGQTSSPSQTRQDWSSISHHGHADADMTLHDVHNGLEARQRSETLQSKFPTPARSSSLLKSSSKRGSCSYDGHSSHHRHTGHVPSGHGYSSHGQSISNTSPGQDDSTPQTSVENGGIVSENFPNELVDLDRAEFLLNEFREMAPFFPFVPLSPSTTAQGMSSRRPLLLLAILMTTSYGDRQLQVALEEQYRQELSNKVFIKGEKSLDHLQSILVYLAWYHFHFKPQVQQIYPMLHLAIGIAVDLGYHQKPKKPVVDYPVQTEGVSIVPSQSREAQRAFLGCYYLSTAFAVALSRPNFVKYTDYMTECCTRIKNDLEFPSDSLIPYMISLHHIGDQINDAFRSEDGDIPPTSQPLVQMHLALLQSQLNEWKSQIPSSPNQYENFAYHFHNMELNSIALRMAAGPPAPNSPLLPSTNNHSILLACLESGKAYLDTLLALPAPAYRHFAFTEWIRLPYVLVLISKLSFPHPTPTAAAAAARWDPRLARERLRLDLYLEALCYRMQAITTYARPAQPLPDFFASMKIILERTRGWYERKARAKPGALDHGAEDSPLEVIRDPHEVPEGCVLCARGHVIPRPLDGDPACPCTAVMEGKTPGGAAPAGGAVEGYGAVDDGWLDNLDDAFWNFDPTLFPEMGEIGGFSA